MNAMTGWAFSEERAHDETIELDLFEDGPAVLAVCSPEEVEVLFSGDIVLTPEQIEQVCQARLAAVDGSLEAMIREMPRTVTEGIYERGKSVREGFHHRG